MIDRGNPGYVLLGRVYVGPVVQPAGAPIIDGALSRSHRQDGTYDVWGGIVITPRASGAMTHTPTRGLMIGLRDRLVPNPVRWRWAPRWLVTPR